LSKGDEVEIDGKLRFRVWSDRRGRRHQGFSILARRVERPGAASSSSAVGSRRPAATVTQIGARMPTKPEQRQLFIARARLRASMPISTYKLWIRPLRLGGITADAVHLVGPTHIRAWVERRYSRLVAEALRTAGLPDHVSFAAVVITDHPEPFASPAAGRLTGRAGATRRPSPRRERGSERPLRTS
jgi:hypothetical protein